MFFIGSVILLLAALTLICLSAGIILLLWKKTQPLGFYAILVEPGAVAGLILGFLIWKQYVLRFVPDLRPTDQHIEVPAIALILATLLWLGITSIAAAAIGFALATWLWWRFSPEPYRPRIEEAYRRFVAGSFWYRPRWNTRQKRDPALPIDPE